ncbi:hypothetical protein BDQ94DRAFT_135196 [Aspergillus welwitschiae]|uniref:Uncharacterized protein n=1 Tax=Aspergillus welwitschiae TaxID=1341132 RepID=A0A3F3QF21_9EURO|nr:hypothetical protein BDQ94DRAFT_135196 [Aspergillus welwitschiae]RDH37874.1 hypothetical protein BDQ94DRAFT_135196 [Aspergillus welwitschiae]
MLASFSIPPGFMIHGFFVILAFHVMTLSSSASVKHPADSTISSCDHIEDSHFNVHLKKTKSTI